MKERVLKPPPAFLFRYRPPEEVTLGYFEGLLRNDHLWASPPRGFTDWYDCRAQIDFDLSKEEMHRYWVRNFKMLGLKGVTASKAAHDVIANRAWKEPGKHAEIIENFQGTLDNSGVICLTDTALGRRMWEDYAAGHRGICLCLETSESPFSLMHDVNYMTELPIVKINADSGEKIEAFLLTKGSSYSWEREWRFVDYDKGHGYRPISPWALRAIVLGSQIEATVREEVLRLTALLKPDVILLTVDASGIDLRLQPLDGHRGSAFELIVPPIQERVRDEPVRRPVSIRLLDYLGSISPEKRRRNLDSRIETVAAGLKAVEWSRGRRSEEAVAAAFAVVKGATALVREIVDRSGAAIPGYGEVAVLLYGIVHEMVIKSGLRI